MPIRPEYRYLYQSPEWIRIRAEILEQAEYCCVRCGRPDGLQVLSQGLRWLDTGLRRWRGPGAILIDLRPPLERGAIVSPPCGVVYLVEVQLGVAHLDNDPSNNKRENLAALCRTCHLLTDQAFHKQTRSANRDKKRPLFMAIL